MSVWRDACRLPTSEWLLLVESAVLDCAVDNIKGDYLNGSAWTSSALGAVLYSEQITRRAALMLPSSLLAETALAKTVAASKFLGQIFRSLLVIAGEWLCTSMQFAS